jgi:hypothetical protein
MFYTLHYGKLKIRETNAPVVYRLSVLFAPTRFGRHSTIIGCSILNSSMGYNVCILDGYIRHNLLYSFNIEHPNDGQMKTETCRCKSIRENSYTTGASVGLFFNN